MQVELEYARGIRRIFGEFGDQLVILKKSAIKSASQEYTLAILQIPQGAAAALGNREPLSICGKNRSSGRAQQAFRQLELAYHLIVGRIDQGNLTAVLLSGVDSSVNRKRRVLECLGNLLGVQVNDSHRISGCRTHEQGIAILAARQPSIGLYFEFIQLLA